MANAQDGRVPVVAGEAAQAGAGDVVQPLLPEGTTTHAPGCACCRPRAAFAQALGRLFVARARGERAFFTRVVVPCAPEHDATLAEALAADPLTAARFRFVGRLAPAAQARSVPSPSPSASCI